jgi:hypothetical protein
VYFNFASTIKDVKYCNCVKTFFEVKEADITGNDIVKIYQVVHQNIG